MKIAIILFNNIKYCPYALTYIKLLENKNYDLNIYYFDRERENYRDFKTFPVLWNSKNNKLSNFLYFKKQMINLLSECQYDYVIVLTTMPGILLSHFLKKFYNKKYILDIRDYTYENNIVYKMIEKSLIKNSLLTTISSNGFKHFLPKYDYLISHNSNYNFDDNSNLPYIKRNGKIIVAYIGSISYKENCKLLINLIEKDTRFCFYFYGNETGNSEIQELIKIINNDRIKFFGPYSPEEKDEIIKSSDILFNVYGNDSNLVKYALSNKLYDCFYYKKPILTSPNTYMSKCANDYSFDIYDDTRDLNDLYNWYISINDYKMNTFFEEKGRLVVNDMKKFREIFYESIEK